MYKDNRTALIIVVKIIHWANNGGSNSLRYSGRCGCSFEPSRPNHHYDLEKCISRDQNWSDQRSSCCGCGKASNPPCSRIYIFFRELIDPSYYARSWRVFCLPLLTLIDPPSTIVHVGSSISRFLTHPSIRAEYSWRGR